MSSPTSITIPLLNPNEPETLLSAIHVSEGQQVSKGDSICILETTKSTVELEADNSGYIIGLRYSQGQTIMAGDLLCYLSDSPEWTPPDTDRSYKENDSLKNTPEGLRITQPALNLAREHNLNLEALPIGPLITEQDIQPRLKNAAGAGILQPESVFDATSIIIFGGGGHGKSLIDLLHALGSYQILGIVDDSLKPGEEVMGVPVLGGGEVLPELYNQGTYLAVNAVGGIGNLQIRMDIFQRLAKARFVCPAVVHPTAVIEPSATLSPGVQIFSQAYIGSDARIGYGTIVNTGAIVSHDCVLGDFVNISPGAILAGMVQVDSGSLVGMGATINLEVKVGSRARIGNGATIKSEVPVNYVISAGTIWPK
jgi:sugar O-acyltransferase (sialic acid O-acetyltransferase NeuD family)